VGDFFRLALAQDRFQHLQYTGARFAFPAPASRILKINGILCMSGPFGRKRRGKGPVINITPLIDVMFLLLIFFMVSSTFRDFFGIDITLPRAATVEEQQERDYEIAVSSEGEFFFDGQAVTLEELRASLRRLLGMQPDTALVLRADEGARFQDVITAIDICREEGGDHLVIPTRLRNRHPEPGTDSSPPD
jgi:biopolymer transport protein ExbD